MHLLTHPSVHPSFHVICVTEMFVWFFWPGPGSPAATLEPVPDPVWQQRGEPLGRPALGFIHSLLHHGGAGLLQHRRQLRTLERERIPGRRQLHPEIRQSLCLTVALSSNFILSFQPQKTLQCTGRRMLANTVGSPQPRDKLQEGGQGGALHSQVSPSAQIFPLQSDFCTVS